MNYLFPSLKICISDSSIHFLYVQYFSQHIHLHKIAKINPDISTQNLSHEYITTDLKHQLKAVNL